MHYSALVLLTAAIAVNAANNVPQHVVYSATGASDVVGNHFGCVHITPSGQASQLGCVKHVFNNGFTVGVTDGKTKVATLCSIAGTSGPCGPAGVNIQVDLTGGTGTAPPPSGPGGTTTLSLAEQKNLPIPGNSALAAGTSVPPTAATSAGTSATGTTTATSTPCVKAREFVA